MYTTTRMLMLSMLLPLLGACSGLKMREDTAERPSYAQDARYETQVAIGPCAFIEKAPETAAIGAALLSNAISAGVNHIGAALTEASQEKAVTAKTSRNILFSSKQFGPCIQIVRGWFHSDPFPLSDKGLPTPENRKVADFQQWKSGDYIDKKRFDALWDNRLWLAAQPDFVFEGRILVAKGNALTIAPQYVRMNEPLFTRSLRRDPTRHVAVFISIHSPLEAADAAGNPAATLVIGKLEPGVARQYVDPAHLTRFDTTAFVINRSPHESDLFTMSVGEEQEPWIVSAAVTETQDASKFLAFVAGVFGDSKETITTELQNRLVPANRASTRETGRQAEEAAQTSYDDKQVAALGALEECRDADAPTPAQAGAVRKALREFNQAARAGKKAEPAAAACIDKFQTTSAAAALKAQCTAALLNLGAGTACN
ncbi:hypothetical protein [Pseudoduganella lutea]|uniref:hypothetical protein n=1 Tax=Pseudoduganella lutea TaxID=321985 RepID=UPI0013EED030|nr:hypothetical protein [Pseudoduganella lutea]